MRKFFLLFFLLVTITINAQTIYSEDFSGQNDQGAIGPNNQVDVSQVDWSVDVAFIALTATSDWFKVTNEVFEARDVDGPQDGGVNTGGVWTSPTIDLTGYNNISISLDVSESGSHELNDYVRASYSIDGGSAVEFGYATDDFDSEVFSVNSLNGSSLVITVEMDNNAGSEYLRMDNILVTGALAGGDTQVSLTETENMIDEDAGTITVCASIVNESATVATTVDLELDNQSSTTNGDDYNMITFPHTLTFPAGSTVAQCLTIDIIDDSIEEGAENIILNLTTPTGGTNAGLGTNVVHTITISANDTPVPSTDVIRINEADVDSPGFPDAEEFVELFGTPNYPLDGLVLVLYNGNGDASYKAIDLDGQILDADGYFIIGGSGAPGNPEIDFGGQTDQLQNGADAIALYVGDDTDFPNGTAVTMLGLVDALVYGTGDGDDSGLAELYSNSDIHDSDEMFQVDEDINNDSENQSIQRGSWFVAAPTPRGEALPVKLLSFSVDSKGKSNQLTWVTATEINNDRFEIQRSVDNKNFETIGEVKGAGDSYTNESYSYTDESPISGQNYYRLKQVDFDGKFEYSKTVRVENRNDKIRIYPSTTTDLITIEIEEAQIATVVVLNSVGAVVKEMSLTEERTLVDLSALTNGVYYIKVDALSGSETKRIVKQ